LNRTVKVVLGVLSLVGGVWAYQYFGTATIGLTSDPSGAVVRVDGRQRGVTPIDRLELSTGAHRVELMHTHYRPQVESVSLGRGDHVKRHVAFDLGEATFEFLSNPRGAWVEVDGERIPGRTPVTYVTTSGPHEIVMGDHERRTMARTVVLWHGETKEVNFSLNIDPHGSVTFDLEPSSAKVEFIGDDVVYSPGVRVPIGEYPVRVSLPGYVTQEFRYEVRYGENVHAIELERAYGELRVIAEPGEAEVTVRFKDRGRDYQVSYEGPMRVPVGDVRVRARAMGHRTGVRGLRLDRGGATVRFGLEPISVEVGATITDALASGGTAPELIVVPSGRFQMGDPQGSASELPVREVVLTQPFAVARREVTVAQYLAFARHTGRAVSEKLDQTQLDHPVTRVSHEDAVAYTDWLAAQTGNSYRLLSEAEWEYVARAGTQGRYFFGTDPAELCEFANVADLSVKTQYRLLEIVACDDGMVTLAPVGSLTPNPFGLYDIYGNVAEWVLDCSVADYAKAPTDGSAVTGRSCATHGYRGGSWDSSEREANSTYRNAASLPNDDRGIRVMRDL
jgi:formylglycine-generating enzyme required for sulfatase activity